MSIGKLEAEKQEIDEHNTKIPELLLSEISFRIIN